MPLLLFPVLLLLLLLFRLREWLWWLLELFCAFDIRWAAAAAAATAACDDCSLYCKSLTPWRVERRGYETSKEKNSKKQIKLPGKYIGPSCPHSSAAPDGIDNWPATFAIFVKFCNWMSNLLSVPEINQTWKFNKEK